MGQKLIKASEIIEHLNACGINNYLIKNSARQRLLGKTPTHWFIAADAPMNKIISAINLLDGIKTEALKETSNEISLNELNGVQGKTTIQSLWKQSTDSFKRQLGSGFTIDSLVLRTNDEYVADIFGGVEDLNAGIIRITPMSVLHETILTAPLIAAETNFKYDEETLKVLRKNAGLIKSFKKEAVSKIFNIMLEKHPIELVQACATDSYSKLFPSFAEIGEKEVEYTKKLVVSVPPRIRLLALFAFLPSGKIPLDGAEWLIEDAEDRKTLFKVAKHLNDEVFDAAEELTDEQMQILVTIKYGMASIKGDISEELKCAKEMLDAGEKIVTPSPIRGMSFDKVEIVVADSAMEPIKEMFAPVVMKKQEAGNSDPEISDNAPDEPTDRDTDGAPAAKVETETQGIVAAPEKELSAESLGFTEDVPATKNMATEKEKEEDAAETPVIIDSVDNSKETDNPSDNPFAGYNATAGDDTPWYLKHDENVLKKDPAPKAADEHKKPASEKKKRKAAAFVEKKSEETPEKDFKIRNDEDVDTDKIPDSETIEIFDGHGIDNNDDIKTVSQEINDALSEEDSPDNNAGVSVLMQENEGGNDIAEFAINRYRHLMGEEE